MNDKSLLKKFQEFEIIFKKPVESIREVHKLRVRCRELLSLLSVDNSLYSKLKRVIKLSNKIRDIDVFFEVYFASLPEKYILKLDLQSIINSTDKNRAKKIHKLHEYLKYLEVPKTIEFKYKKSQFYLTANSELISPNQVELHKYRIYIKKYLYNEKNSFPRNENKIKILTKIKDLLGTINDNINGLNRLRSFKVEEDFFKQIEYYTQEENLRLFKEFKNLDFIEVE